MASHQQSIWPEKTLEHHLIVIKVDSETAVIAQQMTTQLAYSNTREETRAQMGMKAGFSGVENSAAKLSP
ncbi:hypothetical protein Dsin_029201 [Dipteronia sinensis]|uniref:Uncharacterized protein n=1 Tax=Dipteronia sinensis TaxID=43782 RepID=A0AAE0DV57_9ROSI|nr:hypothetical protein Dsin_029201 [Dipteronia sinensis]